MDYLITGATGFVGQKLVNELLARGNEVNYLGRKRSHILDSRAAFHYWNAGETPPLNSISRLDAIIHLAGEPISQRWNAEVKCKIYASRVEGARKLVATIGELKHKPSVLVSASAVGYYGDRGDEILTEASPPASDFLAKLCVDWEHEALRAQDFGLRVIVVRIAVVLGRDGGALENILSPFRLGLGGRFGSGRQWMPWIHIQDLVHLLIFAAENPGVAGPLNACSPEPVTNAEFTKTLGRILHRPTIFPVPKFALKLALGEMAEFAFASQRVIPEATRKTGFQFTYPKLEPALKSILS
jgi:hypothetical protein